MQTLVFVVYLIQLYIFVLLRVWMQWVRTNFYNPFYRRCLLTPRLSIFYLTWIISFFWRDRYRTSGCGIILSITFIILYWALTCSLF